jgi:non-ribosomal peptide synthetase component F
MHHIVEDAWTMGILTRELIAHYQAFDAGEQSPLDELPIQYADFALWQREWLQGEVLEKLLTYWKQQLDVVPAALEFPTDRPRLPVQTYRGTTLSFVLPAALTEALKTLSHREDVTLFMTLLAAYQVLLYRYTGQEDIVVGSPIANRNWAEIEGLIGVFINTLALRTDLSGDPTFRELLDRVRKVTLGAYAHQDLPFELLVDELQPERNLSHSPLFQTMFVFQNAPLEPLQLAGLRFAPLEIKQETVIFDLALIIWETERGLGGTWEYHTDVFDSAAIDRLADHFKTILEAVAGDPERRLLDIPLSRGEESGVFKDTPRLHDEMAAPFDFEL